MSTYTTSFRQADLDVDAIHAFLTRSYWAPGIPRETVARSIQNSLCLGLFCGDAQVGFARAVTDRTTFAYLGDVYVLEEHRGRGLSKRMLNELLAHPDMQGLRRMLLATADAHGLYKRYGFTALGKPDRLMEVVKPGIYQHPPS